MNRPILFLLVVLVLASVASQPLPAAPADPAHNPLIWADVPDIAIIRVGKTYYMSSTTMHLSPGLPIMKSTDLVNWRMASYAYNTLADNEAAQGLLSIAPLTVDAAGLMQTNAPTTEAQTVPGDTVVQERLNLRCAVMLREPPVTEASPIVERGMLRSPEAPSA